MISTNKIHQESDDITWFLKLSWNLGIDKDILFNQSADLLFISYQFATLLPNTFANIQHKVSSLVICISAKDCMADIEIKKSERNNSNTDIITLCDMALNTIKSSDEYSKFDEPYKHCSLIKLKYTLQSENNRSATEYIHELTKQYNHDGKFLKKLGDFISASYNFNSIAINCYVRTVEIFISQKFDQSKIDMIIFKIIEKLSAISDDQIRWQKLECILSKFDYKHVSDKYKSVIMCKIWNYGIEYYNDKNLNYAEKWLSKALEMLDYMSSENKIDHFKMKIYYEEIKSNLKCFY